MGVLNIIALSYLSVISIVVFIHYFNRRSNVVYVPSILPWKSIDPSVVRASAFRVNLLFILQIIIVILLSLFLAQPYFSSDVIVLHGRNSIVVIDSSASMQTLDNGEMRFDIARKQLLRLVNDMKPADEMMVISAYSSAEVVSGLTGDKDTLRETANELMPTETGTDLEGAVGIAVSYLENMRYGRLYILTDQRIDSCGPKIRTIEDGLLHFVRVGVHGSNIAISSLDTFQDIFDDADEAYITVTSYADDRNDVKLSVRMGQDLLMEDMFTLNSHERKTFTVKNISSSGILKAGIDTDDCLKADNAAYGVMKDRSRIIDVLLVTDSGKLRDEFNRLEGAFSQMDIDTVSVDKYDKYGQSALQDYDLCIFHRFIPEGQPDINALFVAPDIRYGGAAEKRALSADVPDDGRRGRGGGGLGDDKVWHEFLRSAGRVRGVEVLDWDDAHPTLKYLDYLDSVKIRDSITFDPPQDANVLIYGRGAAGSHDTPGGKRNDRTLAFSIKLGNRRMVVMGIDLGEFSYSDTENLPVLIMTLNMIQWLSPFGENVDSIGRSNLIGSDQYKTGHLYPLRDSTGIKAIYVDGEDGGRVELMPDFVRLNTESSDETRSNSGGGGSEDYLMLKRTGVYVVERKDGDEVFVVNLFDESESNTSVAVERSSGSEPSGGRNAEDGRVQTAAVPAELSAMGKTREELSDISRYVLYLVPLLLFVEWICGFAGRRGTV